MLGARVLAATAAIALLSACSLGSPPASAGSHPARSAAAETQAPTALARSPRPRPPFDPLVHLG
jgi:hypothetical protein